MKDCVFCKIANKEIPGEIIYEDEEIISFLDLSQITTGHALVVPKKHIENMLNADAKTLKKMYSVAQKVAKILRKKLKVKGFNIFTNVGEVGGQSVNHFHIHVLPRYTKEEFDYKYQSKETDFQKLKETRNKIVN